MKARNKKDKEERKKRKNEWELRREERRKDCMKPEEWEGKGLRLEEKERKVRRYKS